MRSFITWLLILSILPIIQGDSLQISTSSPIINGDSITYTFLFQSTSTSSIPANSVIQIIFPAEYNSIIPTSPICVNSLSQSLTCTSKDQAINITSYFPTVSTDTIYRFRITNMKNPSSSGTTSDIITRIYSGNTLLVGAQVGVRLAEGPCTAYLGQSSKILGGNTKINITVFPTNPIPVNGGLEITFPQWDASGRSMIVGTSPVLCQTEPLVVFRTSYSCSIKFGTSNDTVIISNMNSATVSSNFLFEYSTILNPPVRSNYIITIRTLDSNSKGIDTCTVPINASLPNEITSPSLTCSNQILVSEQDSCVLSFTTYNSLPSGSTIRITFPTSVDISGLTFIIAVLPSFNDQITWSFSGKVVTISNIINSFVPAGTKFTLSLTRIQHPSTVMPTTSFNFETFYLGNVIDQLSTSFTYTAIARTFKSATISANPKTAGSISDITFQLQLASGITATGISLLIQFGNDFTISDTNSANCVGDGIKIKSILDCSFSNRLLNASNIASQQINSDDSISITVKGVQLVTSTMPFSVSIRLQSQNYDVNTISSVSFTCDPGVISDVSALGISDGALVGSTSQYNLTFKNVNPIPTGSIFSITLPQDLQIVFSDTSLLLSNTKIVANGVSMAVTSTLSSSSTPQSLTFTSPYTSSIGSGSTISILIPGLRNPLRAGPTSSFTLSYYTSTGYMIDTLNSKLGVALNQINPSDFQSVSIVPASSLTGTQTSYTIKFVPRVFHQSSFQISVQFPSTFTFSSSISCQRTTPSVGSSISCNPDLTNKINFIIDQNISASTEYGITISGVNNPIYAQNYSNFALSTSDTQYLIHRKTSGIEVIYIASSILSSSASVRRTNNALSASTNLVFQFVPINQYPSDTIIQLKIPTELSISNSLICTNMVGLGRNPDCYKSGTTTIIIGNATSYSKNMIQFSVSSFTNPTTQLNITNFQILASSPSGIIIDQIISGIVLLAPCSSSCYSCESSNMFACTSCFSSQLLDIQTSTCVGNCAAGKYKDGATCKVCDSACSECDQAGNNHCTKCPTTATANLLYNGSCLTACPSQFYGDNNICKNCVSPCLKCSSSSICESCVSGFYYLNQRCLSKCPTGYYGDNITGNCLLCRTNCLTCSQISTCDTCNLASSFPLFSNSDCVSACPQGYIAINNICEKCTSPCLTCSVSKTNCLSCESGLFLSLGQCFSCQSPCASCSESQTKCDSCISNFYLQEKNCVTRCSDGSYLDSGSKSCLKCPSNCLTCSSLDRCASCPTSLPYLYANTTCVITCPSDAPVVVNKICTISSSNGGNNNGGNNNNGTNNGNSSITTPNPYSGLYLSGIPFPFLISSIIGTIFIFVLKSINHQTEATSNVIGILGLLEFGSIFAFIILIILSNTESSLLDNLDLTLAVVGIAAYFLQNLIFSLSVERKIEKDDNFNSWVRKTKWNFITYIIIKFLSLVSFKSYRFCYSCLLGKDQYSYKIPDISNYFRRLSIISCLNFLTTEIFVALGAIISLYRKSNFTQMLNISIEVLIIIFMIIIWTIIEAIKFNQDHYKNSSKTEDTMITNAKLLTALENSIIEKLNISMETSNRLGIKSRIKRKSSVQTDVEFDMHESNLNRSHNSIDNSSFKFDLQEKENTNAKDPTKINFISELLHIEEDEDDGVMFATANEKRENITAEETPNEVFEELGTHNVEIVQNRTRNSLVHSDVLFLKDFNLKNQNSILSCNNQIGNKSLSFAGSVVIPAKFEKHTSVTYINQEEISNYDYRLDPSASYGIRAYSSSAGNMRYENTSDTEYEEELYKETYPRDLNALKYDHGDDQITEDHLIGFRASKSYSQLDETIYHHSMLTPKYNENGDLISIKTSKTTSKASLRTKSQESKIAPSHRSNASNSHRSNQNSFRSTTKSNPKSNPPSNKSSIMARRASQKTESGDELKIGSNKQTPHSTKFRYSSCESAVNDKDPFQDEDSPSRYNDMNKIHNKKMLLLPDQQNANDVSYLVGDKTPSLPKNKGNKDTSFSPKREKSKPNKNNVNFVKKLNKTHTNQNSQVSIDETNQKSSPYAVKQLPKRILKKSNKVEINTNLDSFKPSNDTHIRLKQFSSTAKEQSVFKTFKAKGQQSSTSLPKVKKRLLPSKKPDKTISTEPDPLHLLHKLHTESPVENIKWSYNYSAEKSDVRLRARELIKKVKTNPKFTTPSLKMRSSSMGERTTLESENQKVSDFQLKTEETFIPTKPGFNELELNTFSFEKPVISSNEIGPKSPSSPYSQKLTLNFPNDSKSNLNRLSSTGLLNYTIDSAIKSSKRKLKDFIDIEKITQLENIYLQRMGSGQKSIMVKNINVERDLPLDHDGLDLYDYETFEKNVNSFKD